MVSVGCPQASKPVRRHSGSKGEHSICASVSTRGPLKRVGSNRAHRRGACANLASASFRGRRGIEVERVRCWTSRRAPSLARCVGCSRARFGASSCASARVGGARPSARPKAMSLYSFQGDSIRRANGRSPPSAGKRESFCHVTLTKAGACSLRHRAIVVVGWLAHVALSSISSEAHCWARAVDDWRPPRVAVAGVASVTVASWSLG